MPAKSKSQQRLFALVNQCKKKGKCASPEVKKIAKGISEKDAHDFAATKHKGLPERKESTYQPGMTFSEFVAKKKSIKYD